MTRSAVTVFLIMGILALPSRIGAQCSNGQQLLDRRPRIDYKEHTERGMLNDAQWDKALKLGRSNFDTPYIAGFLETNVFKGWKLVDITDVRQLDAVMAAVSSNGQTGHVFFADYRYVPKKELLLERIRKADLKFYNSMLRAEGITVSSSSQALDVSLTFLKVSTHRARGFFIQLINNSSDIPKLNDEKRRFSGIVREVTDESTAAFTVQIERLSNVIVPPHYSEHSGKYNLSFFTWDPVFGDVEHWCITVSGSGIDSFTRKLISNGI